MPTAITAAQLEEEQASDFELTRILQGTTSLKLKKAFSYIHNLSHPSGRATARQIRQKFVWPSMNKDVLKWCRFCLPCQRSKIHKHNHLQPEKIAVPNGRFDHVHLDILWRSGHTGYPVLDHPKQSLLIKARSLNLQFSNNLIGSKHIHTTAYHPQSNGLIERWHRSFKSSLMCSSGTPWPQLLPTVLLSLRTCFKEDIKSSAAEMLYGVPIRLPNEFFANMDETVDPTTFLSSFREHMQKIRPTPTSHHIKEKMFLLKGIDKCTHVFLRIDAVKQPLEPPYTGPYEIIKRDNDRVFTIRIDGKDSAVSVDRLKPVFLVKDDKQFDSEESNPTPQRTYEKRRKVRPTYTVGNVKYLEPTPQSTSCVQSRGPGSQGSFRRIESQ
ncbi:uncharacterized protein LOC122319660 [Drosophila yakuba]|uniref:uncharacterized protein LOC122319660 n=1 Tax=Drosophila yakuba TaxID=7245 RepID=UPI001C8A8772|nr:uncharacterized protein LOC122319660 [Drosophila yakuba]